jgi:hypothetical protein
MLRHHILLRWGRTPVNAITSLSVNKWIADLHTLGYANSTITGIVKLLSMILTDAADEGLIPANPVHRRRRCGRRSHQIQRERGAADRHGYLGRYGARRALQSSGAIASAHDR